MAAYRDRKRRKLTGFMATVANYYSIILFPAS
jgi:hypothetical protein